ncbi:MAG: 4-(cytidine 5'-diphospho)-2-C-methyl-D-erythritol kinase [Candidatus Obscuribacter phosphatis]|uniref:4-diphosphocytidyl-2-C-methyl-D-erythritol kinase n=1 Tax=Candidatus Obscuribacter phosphatis TaxID=1906157 RepID=A0A8J7PA09_9BACT|nr:4-(cytidine 5'-diphospho)-2-C-methyl-D-erythritol kinase [Candidatus Obscuribacter phosphatis]
MSTKIKVIAPAKINLTFELKGLFEDGYHRVSSLMQSISLADLLTFDIERNDSPGIELKAAKGKFTSEFPISPDNLIAKAIRLYLSSMEKPEPLKVKVEIEKNIPIGAGMAGGSGNAAAALLALNAYFEERADQGNALKAAPFSQDELLSMGSKLGVDVPFSFLGGTARAEGRGEILQALSLACDNQALPLHMVLAKPRHLHIATPWAFKKYDQFEDKLSLSEKLKDRGITDDATGFACQNLLAGDQEKAITAFGNDFEQAIFPDYRELKGIKQRFMNLGARVCHMTGSGPTIYAIARDTEHAVQLKEAFEESVLKETTISCAAKSDPVDLFVVQTLEHGVKILD